MDIQTAYNADTGTFNWSIANVQLGLQTAAIISLFTARRAAASDALPDGGDDRRGWWGDAFPEIPGDSIGSLTVQGAILSNTSVADPSGTMSEMRVRTTATLSRA